MSYFDIARDLANALNKAANGAKTLNSSPTPTEQVGAYIAEVSALANAISAAANTLKEILPAGTVATASGANALINIANLEVQTALLLNQSIESGDVNWQ